MSSNNDTAVIVISEQLRRLLEQERGRFEFTMPDCDHCTQGCSLLNKDQIFETALLMAVMMKISIAAKLN